MKKLWNKKSIMAVFVAAMLMSEKDPGQTIVHASGSEIVPDGYEQHAMGEGRQDGETEQEDQQMDIPAEEPYGSIQELDMDEADLQIRLVEQTLCETVQGVNVKVSGSMPEGAELYVEQENCEEKGVVYSLSVLCAEGEYDPGKYRETLEVSFEMTSYGRNKETKTYTIYDQDNSRKIGNIISGGTASFRTDRLSRYVVMEDVNYDGDTQWQYGYIGGSQSFIVPVTGVYRFELYGAQGSDYQEHQGGKGGMVSVELELMKDEEVELIVGGKEGFHGGGSGTLSNGGGATTLLVNGGIAATAGGGGGATDLLDGGDGGSTKGAGTNADTGDSSGEYHTAGGGGGYLGGTCGYTRYHVHTGNSQGGGCYTSEVKHVHSPECETMCGTYQEFSESISSPGYINAHCDKCGAWGCRQGSMNSSFIHDGSWKHMKQICGKNPDVTEYYSLGCGKQSTTVEAKAASSGGTSYFDGTLCSKGVMVTGVQEGDGKVQIDMIEMDGATLSYYNYDMKLLGSITVAKGDKAVYPLTDIPERISDNRYTYRFEGWDYIQTEEKEIMEDSLTIQDEVLFDRDYLAVYQSIPREYMVTLENGSVDEQTVTAIYGQRMPEIKVPQREGYLFAGYYTKPQGAGIQYYSENGEQVRNSGITENATLYAYWIQPLVITEQPEDMILQTGYQNVMMETNYTKNFAEGYDTELQWFVDKDGIIEPISEARSRMLMIPEDYTIGTYKIWCELKVTSSYNGQVVTMETDKAELKIILRYLQDKDIACEMPNMTYDGKAHPVMAKLDTEDKITIYYGEQPLNADNYSTVGTKQAYSYADAGIYQVYLYITGEGYEDYAGSIHMEILKAKWTIDEGNYPVVHKNGTVTFPGEESWEYNVDVQDQVSYQHYDGNKLSEGDYLFRIEGDANHIASDPVMLTVNSVQEGGNSSQTGTGNGSSSQAGAENEINSQTGTGNGSSSQAKTENGNDSRTGTENENNSAEKSILDSRESNTESDTVMQEKDKVKGAYYDRKQANGDQKSTAGQITSQNNHAADGTNNLFTDRQNASGDRQQTDIDERTRAGGIGMKENTQPDQSDLHRAEVSFIVGTMILAFLFICILILFTREKNAKLSEAGKDY